GPARTAGRLAFAVPDRRWLLRAPAAGDAYLDRAAKQHRRHGAMVGGGRRLPTLARFGTRAPHLCLRVVERGAAVWSVHLARRVPAPALWAGCDRHWPGIAWLRRAGPAVWPGDRQARGSLWTRADHSLRGSTHRRLRRAACAALAATWHTRRHRPVVAGFRSHSPATCGDYHRPRRWTGTGGRGHGIFAIWRIRAGQFAVPGRPHAGVHRCAVAVWRGRTRCRRIRVQIVSRRTVACPPGSHRYRQPVATAHARRPRKTPPIAPIGKSEWLTRRIAGTLDLVPPGHRFSASQQQKEATHVPRQEAAQRRLDHWNRRAGWQRPQLADHRPERPDPAARRAFPGTNGALQPRKGTGAPAARQGCRCVRRLRDHRGRVEVHEGRVVPEGCEDRDARAFLHRGWRVWQPGHLARRARLLAEVL